MQIDWLTVAAQIANFLVLVWLLQRFLYRPITEAMARREERIEAGLSAAKSARAEVDARASRLQEERAALEANREAVLDQARTDHEAKLKEMGYTIEPAEMDNGKFLAAVKTGNLVYTSGQVSAWDGDVIKGKVGGDLSVDDGYKAARYCALNCLRAVKAVTGNLDDIVRVVKVLGMVNVAPDFDNTPGAIHGCSDFIREVFGEAGHHARSAVGMTIPFNFAVEIEMVVEVK